MGVIGGIVAGVASFLGASGAAAAAIGTAVNLGLAAWSIASSVGAAKEQRQAAERARLADINRNAFRNFRQALTPRRIIFGRCRVAGPLIFAHNRKKHGTHFVVALAGHEVEEIESVWLLEDPVPFVRTGTNTGRVSGKYSKGLIVQVFRGTATQNIGAAMINARDVRAGVSRISLDPQIIEDTDKYRGIAAIYAITRAWSQLFEGETPEFSAIVKGNNQIYDPRMEATGYTANPALCAAWYITAIMGFPWASLDEAALVTAADHCDATVPLKAGGTEKRYECHGVITADTQHREALDMLARSMAGVVRYAQGKWVIQAGAALDIDPVPLSEDHAQASYEVLFDPPDRTLPNAVRGSHIDPATWQPRAYPQRELSAAIAAEGGPWWHDVDLPLTLSHSMAQRIAKIELLRARARRRFSVEMDLSGLRAKPGSVVTWSAPEIGMDDSTFEVDAFSFVRREGKVGTVLGTRLDLVEWDADFFGWNPATDEKEGDNRTATPGGFEATAPEGCYTEKNVHTTGDTFSADYDIGWTDPEIEEASLTFVRATVKVIVTWSTGETTATATDDIDPGVGEGTINVTTSNPGMAYVSHEIEVTLVAYYSNGLNSGPGPFGACELPEPGDTLHGVPSAGSFPNMHYEWDIPLARYLGTTDPDRVIIYNLQWELYGPSGFAVASKEETGPGPSDPRGVYVATPFGEDTFNGGNPWTYTVT